LQPCSCDSKVVHLHNGCPRINENTDFCHMKAL
jgi:hypothetical protein